MPRQPTVTPHTQTLNQLWVHQRLHQSNTIQSCCVNLTLMCTLLYPSYTQSNVNLSCCMLARNFVSRQKHTNDSVCHRRTHTASEILVLFTSTVNRAHSGPMWKHHVSLSPTHTSQALTRTPKFDDEDPAAPFWCRSFAILM